MNHFALHVIRHDTHRIYRFYCNRQYSLCRNQNFFVWSSFVSQILESLFHEIIICFHVLNSIVCRSISSSYVLRHLSICWQFNCSQSLPIMARLFKLLANWFNWVTLSQQVHPLFHFFFIHAHTHTHTHMHRHVSLPVKQIRFMI